AAPPDAQPGRRPLAPAATDGGAGGGERRGRPCARRAGGRPADRSFGRRRQGAGAAARAPAHGGDALLLRGTEQRRGRRGARRAGGGARGASGAGAAQAARPAGEAHGGRRMTPERFETIVAAYGAEPRRWPEQEREAALAFAGTEAGAASLAAARRPAALLDRAGTPRARRELVARAARTPWRLRAGWAAQAATLAAAALLGLYVGWTTPTPTNQLVDDPWETALLIDWDEG